MARRALALAVPVVALVAAACGGGRGGGNTTAATGSAPTTAPAATLTATTEPWHLTYAVSRPAVVTSGSDVVILGGLATGDVSTSAIRRVDPGAGTEKEVGSLARAVHDTTAATSDGRVFVFGGGSASTVATVQGWSAGPASVVADLPQPRSDLSSATVGPTTYVVGGFDGSAMVPTVLSTTDGTRFDTAGRLAVPVRYPAVVALNGYVWVIGGVTSTSESGTADTDVIQRFNPRTGTATVVGHLPQPVGHAAAVALSGNLFVVGGRSGTTPLDQILRVDTSTGATAPAGRLPQPRSDAGVAVVGPTAYLLGGEVSGPTQPLDTVVALRLSAS